jgi:hypothetical protein
VQINLICTPLDIIQHRRIWLEHQDARIKRDTEPSVITIHIRHRSEVERNAEQPVKVFMDERACVKIAMADFEVPLLRRNKYRKDSRVSIGLQGFNYDSH